MTVAKRVTASVCSRKQDRAKEKIKKKLNLLTVLLCNKWQGSSPRLSAWATQAPKKRRSDGELLDWTAPPIESHTYGTDNSLTELTFNHNWADNYSSMTFLRCLLGETDKT